MKFAALSTVLVAVAGLVAAAPTDSDIVVTYQGIDGPFVFSFGDCVPFKMNGAVANTAEVNKFAKCFGFSDDSCQYQDMPAPVVVPPGMDFVNEGDPAEVIGESAMCWELE